MTNGIERDRPKMSEKKKETAQVMLPWARCPLCTYFQQKHIVSATSEGLVITCDLESLCRNAVHIAWNSLTVEERKAREEGQDDTH